MHLKKFHVANFRFICTFILNMQNNTMPTDNTPLDALFLPDAPPPKSRARRLVQRIAWVIEGALIGMILLGLFFKFQSWEGGNELLILGFGILMLFYVSMLWSVAGSSTWAHGLLTVPVGFAMMFGLYAILFRWEYWEGAAEMAILSFSMLLLGALATAVVMAIRYAKSANRPYYWHILLRLVVLLCLTAPGFLKVFWG